LQSQSRSAAAEKGYNKQELEEKGAKQKADSGATHQEAAAVINSTVFQQQCRQGNTR